MTDLHSRRAFLARGSLAGVGAIGGAVVKGTTDFVRFQEQMNEVFTLLPNLSGQAMEQMQSDVLAFSQLEGRFAERL